MCDSDKEYQAERDLLYAFKSFRKAWYVLKHCTDSMFLKSDYLDLIISDGYPFEYSLDEMDQFETWMDECIKKLQMS